MEHYEIYSNDPANNRLVATFQIPDEVLCDLQQNPNDAFITMIKNKTEFVLSIKDRIYNGNYYNETGDVDFYCVDKERRRFDQVGTVQRKLSITSKVNENMKQITKDKTRKYNEKNSQTVVLSHTGTSKSKSVERRKKAITTTSSTVKPISRDMTEKPHFSEEVKSKLKNKSIAVSAPSEPKKKRKRQEDKPTKTKKRKETKETAEQSSSSESDDSSSEDEDLEQDLESLLDNVTTKPASPAPPTNGTTTTAKLAAPVNNTPVVPIKSMLEEDSSLDSRRIQDYDKKEPTLRREEITNIHDYISVKEEYGQKYQIYSLLDSKLEANKTLFKNLTEQYLRCNDMAEKNRIGETLKKLFSVRQEEVKKFTHIYCILHEELLQLKKLVTKFVESKRQ
jgi:hypothetical protein